MNRSASVPISSHRYTVYYILCTVYCVSMPQAHRSPSWRRRSLIRQTYTAKALISRKWYFRCRILSDQSKCSSRSETRNINLLVHVLLAGNASAAIPIPLCKFRLWRPHSVFGMKHLWSKYYLSVSKLVNWKNECIPPIIRPHASLKLALFQHQKLIGMGSIE